MIKVKKEFGEYPIKTAVLDTVVEFDENGEAEVSEDIAKVLSNIPGYAVANDPSEGEEQEPPKKATPPKKPAPKAPAKKDE